MNIIITVNYSPWSSYSGGGQNSAHNLATALQARGHDITVVYTKPPWEKIAVPADVTYTIRWAFFFGLRSTVSALFRPLNALSVARAVKKILREKPVSIIHSQGEEGAFIGRLKKKFNFRFIVTPRYPSYPDALFRKQTIIEKILLHSTRAKYTVLKYALKKADCCCPTSKSSREHIIAAYGIPANKIRVVPNGIRQIFFTGTRKKTAQNGPAVFFGRITEEKGVDIFIHALHKLGKSRPRAIIIGRGDYLPAATSLIKEYALEESVEILDWKTTEELIDILSGARMAVLPSREESFGNAMVETLALGVPLVTTTVGSLPEIISKDMAILTPVGDSEATVKGMNWIIKNQSRAEKMAQKGSRHIQKNFSWDATAASFEKIYQGTR